MRHCSALLASAAILVAAPQAQERDDYRRDQRSAQERSASQQQATQTTRVLASQLIDREIRTRDDSEATIEDMVYSPGESKIAFLLVSDGEGDDYNAIPIDKLEIRKRGQEDEIVVRLGGAELSQWPSIPEDDYQQATTPDFAQKVKSKSREGSGGRTQDRFSGGDRRTAYGSSDDEWGQDERLRNPNAKMVFVSDLMDREVMTSNREDEVGDIENLAIDVRNGQVPFVIVGTGGFLGMGETLRAVPVEKLRFEQMGEERELIADLSEQDISGLPTFERDAIDTMSPGETGQTERTGEEGTRSGGRTARSGEQNDAEAAWIVQVWEVYTVPVATGPSIVEKSARLPLDIPSDEKVAFVVDVNIFENQLGEDQQTQDEDDAFFARPEGETQRTDRDRGNRDRNTDRRSAMSSTAPTPRRAVYEISAAQDQGDGSKKLDVKVMWFGGWAGDQTGSQDSWGETGTTEAGADRDSRGQTGQRRNQGNTAGNQGRMSQGLQQSGAKTRHFTVTLEGDGSISNIDTQQDAMGQAWSDREETRQDDKMALHGDRVRSHLEMVIGAGLHGKALQPGEKYACSSKDQGKRAFCLEYRGRTAQQGETETQGNQSGNRDRQGQNQRQNQGQNQGQNTGRNQNEDPWAGLNENRNQSNQRNQSQNAGFAKFTIKSPDDSVQMGGSGQAQDQQRGLDEGNQRQTYGQEQQDRQMGRTGEGQDMGQNRQSGSQSIGRAGWAGTAIYSLDDGLLEALIARHVDRGQTCTVSIIRSQTGQQSGMQGSGNETGGDRQQNERGNDRRRR